jgi:HEAT repeat protein
MGVQPAAAPASAPAAATSDSALELILTLAGQTDAETRRATAMEVLKLKSSVGNRALARLLQSKGNETVKLAVCDALATLKLDEAAFIAPLMGMLSEKDPALRKAAAAALNNYRDQTISEKLQAFVREQDAQLLAERHAALMRALYECTAETDRLPLVLSWIKQPLALERLTALDIVQQTMRKGPPEPLLMEQIRTLLTDSDETVRQKAILVVRARGLREDAARVEAVVQSEQPVAIREAAYNTLGVLGEPSSIPVVLHGLEDPSQIVSAEAATALARLCEAQPALNRELLKGCVEGLLAKAGDGLAHPRLREQIVDAMGRIADPRFVQVLTRYGSGEESIPAVRQAAIRGLGRIGDRASMAQVIDRLDNEPDAGVREAAADALGRLATRASELRFLRERLDPKVEPSLSVQMRAWEAYLAIFNKLTPADQREVVATWASSDPLGADRRIELLTVLEKQSGTGRIDPGHLTDLREELGDALIAASRPADASAVLARGLESVMPSQGEQRARIARKLIDADLRIPAPDKALAAAAGIQSKTARDAAAQRLLEFATVTAASDGPAARAFLYSLKQSIPDQFGPTWGQKFDALRAALAATQPATAAAAN